MNSSVSEFASIDSLLRLAADLDHVFYTTALASLRVLVAFSILPPTGSQALQGLVRGGLIFMVSIYVLQLK